MVNPHSVPDASLPTLAWQVAEPQYHARLTKLSEEFEQARSKGFAVTTWRRSPRRPPPGESQLY